MQTGTPSDPSAVNRADTIVARFIDRASSDPERVAFTTYPMGALQALGSFKWGDWITTARAVGGALLARHAERGERVAIFADNRTIWPVAAMGIAMCGLVRVAIPPNGSVDDVFAQLEDCGAIFVIVDTVARFKMLRSIVHRLSRSITIICDDLEPLRSSVAEGMSEWDTWCRFGAQALIDYPSLRDRLSERLDNTSAEHCASITYALGSHVGIARTYETIMADALALVDALHLTFRDRLAIAPSFCQPFAHLLAIEATILAGDSVALIEHPSGAFDAARHFEATVFVGDERALAHVRDRLAVARTGDGYVRDAACEILGRYCRLATITNAVFSLEFQRDLSNANVSLATVYGSRWQTCICINGPEHFDDGAIGKAFDDVALRIGDHSELLVSRNAHSASGTCTRSDESDLDFTSDGLWIRTGHCVERSMSGSFRIVGEMKDMLEFITGRRLSSHAIETLLTNLPLVAHAVCQADGANSLVAVLALDRSNVEAWAFQRGLVAPWEALVEHPMVYEELARGVASVNAQRDVGERISAFAPTELEFSVHSGELDESGALVRSVIESRFRHVFAELHQHRSN
ncbi:MAG: AMP-binding protein [Gemmatimonas sp.]